MELMITHITALEYWRISELELKSAKAPSQTTRATTLLRVKSLRYARKAPSKSLGARALGSVLSNDRQTPTQLPPAPPPPTAAPSPPAAPPPTQQHTALTQLLPLSPLLAQLTLPLNITVNSRDLRRPSQAIKPHVSEEPFPSGAITDTGTGLLVSSPELCFLQMATELSLVELIELGYELCGSYSLYGPGYPNTPVSPGTQTSPVQASHTQNKQEEDGFYSRPPLTSVKKLRSFLAKAKGSKGARKATRALKYIADDSASPMETILAILLTLPYHMGGYGLPMPILNHRIKMTRAAKQTSDRAYYLCDFYWALKNVAVEYDSTSHHGTIIRIAADSTRRNSLTTTGLTIISINALHIYNNVKFTQAAALIARNLGKRLRGTDTYRFYRAQRELRRVLLK